MTEDINEIDSLEEDYIGIEGAMTEINCTVESSGNPIPHGIETSASGDYTNGFSTINLGFGELDKDGNYTGSRGFIVNLSLENAEYLLTNLMYLLDRVKEENENASDVA